MKSLFFLLFLIINYLPSSAQTRPFSFKELYQLDSLGNSNSIAKHFGGLYFIFLQYIEEQLDPADSASKHLVRRFEKTFAQFFIDASEAYHKGRQISFPDWQAYFSVTGLQPIQYKLLGANAHLNGGLWQALTNSFTREEMQSLKTHFRIFKKSLNKTYKLIYSEAANSNRRIETFGKLTMGMDQWLGNYYLYKWRKRQMRLARLYWSESSRFPDLLAKVNRKRNKIDQLILNMP